MTHPSHSSSPRSESEVTARAAIRVVLLLAALISPSACGVSETVCEDFSTVILSAAVRCDNILLNEGSVDQMMQCPLAKGVWDEDQLRDECFPALETLDCGLLLAMQFPDACQNQLIYFP